MCSSDLKRVSAALSAATLFALSCTSEPNLDRLRAGAERLADESNLQVSDSHVVEESASSVFGERTTYVELTAQGDGSEDEVVRDVTQSARRSGMELRSETTTSYVYLTLSEGDAAYVFSIERSSLGPTNVDIAAAETD